MILRVIGVFFLVSGLSGATPTATDSWQVIRLDGVGPVRVGMTLAQVNTATHEKLHWPSKSDVEDRNCFFASPKRHPDVSLMFEKGRLTRVDLNKSTIKTSAGIGIGDSERRAIAVYGRKLKIEPNAYTGPENHDLTYSSSDGKKAIKFIVDSGKIRLIYAGAPGSVSYIEGCE